MRGSHLKSGKDIASPLVLSEARYFRNSHPKTRLDGYRICKQTGYDEHVAIHCLPQSLSCPGSPPARGSRTTLSLPRQLPTECSEFMLNLTRRSLLKASVLAMAALTLPVTVSPAQSAPFAFTPKGTYTGTYASTEGHGSGKFTLKVSSAKPGPNNSFQIKGSVKLGKNSLKVLIGTVVPNPDGGWVIGAPVFNSKATVLGGVDLLLNATDKSFTGNYQLLTRDNQSIDAGTLTGNKK